MLKSTTKTQQRLEKQLCKAKEAAAAQDGICLSSQYISVKTKMHWQCKKGHQWYANFSNVVGAGSWCPVCAQVSRNQKRILPSEKRMQEILINNNGRCLTKEITTIKTKMLWQCEIGHKWHASLSHILNGHWCPECRCNLMHEKAQTLAKQNGGQCLSDKYLDSQTKLHWQCKLGHHWLSKVSYVEQGNWCPECRSDKELSDRKNAYFEKAKELAIEKNGRCLAKEYVNAQTKMLWQCQYGHQWLARTNNIQQGNWCPECKKQEAREHLRKLRLEQPDKLKRKPIYTIEYIYEVAKKKKGRCLTDALNDGVKSRVTLVCEKRHTWTTTVSRLINANSWCPECNKGGRPKGVKANNVSKNPYNGGIYCSRRSRNTDAVIKRIN